MATKNLVFSYAGPVKGLMDVLFDVCIAEDEEREVIDLRVQQLFNECEGGRISYDQYLVAVRKLYRVGSGPVPQPKPLAIEPKQVIFVN